MSILEIRDAQREGARLVIGLAGVSGSGKTVTAIMLAYGLANYDPRKVGLMDAENRRGSLNADVLQSAVPPSPVPFLIGDLVAPFSPERYIEGIKEFQAAGIEVLIIDSVTHEHEGPGGLIDIAGPLNKYWNKAKAEHKKFVNALLQCDMHIIVCVRARERSAPGVDAEGKKTYIDEGLQPITEKNLMFEMTASLMMSDNGKTQKDLKGMPPSIAGALGRGTGYITPADGKALRDWVDGAKQLDPTVEKFRNRLLSNCDSGAAQTPPKSNLEHIEDCWGKTPATVQTALGEKFHEMLKSSAAAYDKHKAEAGEPEKTESQDQASPAAAIAATANAGRAAKTETADATAAKAAAAKPAETTKPAETAQPKPAQAAQPADNVTKLHPVATQEKPLASAPAPKKTALADPLF